MRAPDDEDIEANSSVLISSVELRLALQRLSQDFTDILDAFNLNFLYDGGLVEIIRQVYLSKPSSDTAESSRRQLYNIGLSYRSFRESYSPFERLFVSNAEKDHFLQIPSGEFYSIVIEADNSQTTSADTVKDVLETLTAIHHDLESLNDNSSTPLTIISIHSGSPIRINLKGSGDAIDALRRLIIDVWNQIRH
ncbi:MAG: hypothetical protein AAF747_03610 [Planctomycetota bacterium]